MDCPECNTEMKKIRVMQSYTASDTTEILICPNCHIKIDDFEDEDNTFDIDNERWFDMAEKYMNGIYNGKDKDVVMINNKPYGIGNDKVFDFIKDLKNEQKIRFGLEKGEVVFIKSLEPIKEEPHQTVNVMKIDPRTLNIEIQSVFKELDKFIDCRKYNLSNEKDVERIVNATVCLYRIRKRAEAIILGGKNE